MNRNSSVGQFLPLLLCLGVTASVWAHGATSEQIKQLTEQIKTTPNKAELYLRRGELHRHLSNAKAALEDYDMAQKLAPERVEIDVYRARLYLDAKVPEMAQLALDRYLKLRPQHTAALLLRAQANAQLGARALAIADYTTALNRLTEPSPELFLARAQLQLAARQFDAALKGLDEGIARLGSLVTLQLQAVELEVKRQRWEAALRRLDLVMAQATRKEAWLVQRAEILRQAGRAEEAREAIAAALQLIADLPDYLRKTEAVKTLQTKALTLQQSLPHTKKSGNNSAPGTN